MHGMARVARVQIRQLGRCGRNKAKTSACLQRVLHGRRLICVLRVECSAFGRCEVHLLAMFDAEAAARPAYPETAPWYLQRARSLKQKKT